MKNTDTVTVEFWIPGENLISQLGQLRFVKLCCYDFLENVSICGHSLRPENLNKSTYYLVTITDSHGNKFEKIVYIKNFSVHAVSMWASPHNPGFIIILNGARALSNEMMLQEIEAISGNKQPDLSAIDSFGPYRKYALRIEEKYYGC